jgi:superoxide reductase
MKEQKFFRCNHCGNMVTMIHDSGARVVCCGDQMTYLDPNTSDGAKEKHVPEVTIEGNLVKVQVGSVIHPMTEAHYIQWIFVQTRKGGQIKYLQPGEMPYAEFTVIDDEVVAVFEYCNLHKLFKKVIKEE